MDYLNLNFCCDGEIDLNSGNYQLNWHEDTPERVEFGFFNPKEDYEYEVLDYFTIDMLHWYLDQSIEEQATYSDLFCNFKNEHIEELLQAIYEAND